MRREYNVMGRQGKLVQVLYQSVLILSPRTWPGLLVASNRNSTQTNLYIKRDFIRTPNRNTGGLMCFKQGHQASLVFFFCKLLSLHYCFSPTIVAKWSWTALGLHPTSWKPPGAGGGFFLCSLSLPGSSHVSIHEPVPAVRLFSPQHTGCSLQWRGRICPIHSSLVEGWWVLKGKWVLEPREGEVNGGQAKPISMITKEPFP